MPAQTQPVTTEVVPEPETMSEPMTAIQPVPAGPSSVSELKPIESLGVLNGKWFIGELKGVSDL